ncbi:MAG TPA: ABC transporter permease [Candidatus Saccharimonadales bacterium]|jgi:ABC transporter DrrB family efflux protein|nr:ABC transporter permease [Candidatus Saccharimonadales bacterium]
MIYHARVTLATAGRVLRQLSHDPRTLALIFLVPCLLLGLLKWLYSDNDRVFNQIGPALLGVFPFVIMFLITSIATLRERSGGTLERLLAMPIGKIDLLLGYAIAFGLLAIVQSLLASFLALQFLGLSVNGPNEFVILVAVLDAILGSALGLFVSAFARTEFQAVQFMPAIILPQFLLCGLLLPLDKMPDILANVAYFSPLTYAVDALNRVVSETNLSGEAWRDVGVVGGCILIAIILGAATLRRSSK